MSLSNNVQNPTILPESTDIPIPTEFIYSEPNLDENIKMRLEHQLCQLQQDNLNIKFEYDRNLVKLRKERDDSEETLKQMSSDLEQQIDECIEINIKYDDTIEKETEFKNNLIKMINELPKSNVDFDHIVGTIKRSLKSGIDEKMIMSAQNTSIIDLDLVPMESLSLHDDEHENVLQECADTTDNSPCELDSLESEMMMEKLDKLDWENSENIDVLFENSISIFMNSVIMKMKLPTNSSMEVQLKRAFSDFGSVLSTKLRSVQSSCADLNSTIVFEKLEQELQKDIDLNDVKDQLCAVVSENRILLTNVEEMTLAKEDSDKQVVLLTTEKSSLNSELELLNEELHLSISTAKVLENLNSILEMNTKKLTEEIRCLNDDFEKLHADFENIKVQKDLSNDALTKVNSDLKDTELKLNLKVNELELVQMEKCNLAETVETMEKVLSELLAENKRLAEFTNTKNNDDELTVLHKRLEDVTAENDDLQSRLTQNGDILQSTIEQKCAIQQAFDFKVLELDGVVADYIKSEEELESSKSVLLKKKAKLDDAREALRTCELEMRKVRSENEEIKSAILANMDSAKIQSSEVSSNVRALKEKLEMVVRENISEVEEMASSRLEMKTKLEKLEIHHKETEIRLVTVENERDRLMISVHELEEKCSKEYRDDDEHLREIESWKCQVEDLAVVHEAVVGELLMDVNELTAKVKAIEEKIRTDTERFTTELSSRENRLIEVSSELQCKSDALYEMGVELAVLRQHKDAAIEQANVLKETESRLQNIEIAMAQKNDEIVILEKEVARTHGLLSDLYRIQEKVKEDLDRLRSYEQQVKDKDVEMQVLRTDILEVEKENEILRTRIKEAVGEHMKEMNSLRLRLELNAYKDNHSPNDKENVSRLEDEIASLKCKLKEDAAKVISVREYDALEKVYDELKERYRDKRRRTEELNAKYEKLLSFCKEKGVVIAKTVPGGR